MNYVLARKITEQNRHKIVELQQYCRQNYLEIKGILLTKNEDVNYILMCMAKVLAVPFYHSHIAIAHHLQSLKDAKLHPMIVVQFVSHAKRGEGLRTARVKGIRTTDLSASGKRKEVCMNIFVNVCGNSLVNDGQEL